ncbi:MAG TPA: hypothetical protein VNB94_08840 [Mycobacteriales bacterium]|nr:hypothetical protein [Mycobacteriales bacterium]
MTVQQDALELLEISGVADRFRGQTVTVALDDAEAVVTVPAQDPMPNN